MDSGALKILIVEDSTAQAFKLRHSLEGRGFTVEWAKNGSAAFELARSYHPDLIISDIMMPVMGHTVIESTRLLAAVTRAFVDFCAEGLEANAEQCEEMIEKRITWPDAS